MTSEKIHERTHNGPNALDTLIRQLAGVPGLGPRSARRAALHLLSRRQTHMIPLAQALHNAAQQVRECAQCGNLDSEDPCSICNNPNREASQICVVAQVSDVWAIERTGFYRGHYHVLGGVLSALDGIGPEQLKIPALIARTLDPRIREIILALSATVDGQTTAHYIHDHLDTSRLTISRLAQGMPMGGQLDYLDDGTIITALRARGAA